MARPPEPHPESLRRYRLKPLIAHFLALAETCRLLSAPAILSHALRGRERLRVGALAFCRQLRIVTQRGRQIIGDAVQQSGLGLQIIER